MTKLQSKRLAAGLSQSQLAIKAGVNVRMIQHYEQGQKSINKAAAETVLKLADALGVSVRDILEG